MRRMWQIVALLAVLCESARGDTDAGSASQPSAWRVSVWQTDEGLPDNRISGVMQASDGYLWVATLGGLMRFDGSDFEELPTFPITRFPNQNVRGLLQDRRGRVWLVMDLGMVLCIDGREVAKYDINEAGGNSALRALAEDGEGSVWVVRRNAVLRIRGGAVEVFGEKDGVPAGDYAWGAADSSGVFWLVRGNRVCAFREGRFVPLFSLDAANVCLAPARAGGMWIVTPSQVLKSGAGGEPEAVARLPRRTVVRSAREDCDGSLWIGSTSGLLHVTPQGVEPVELPRPLATAIEVDREGNLWVGTDGGGLCRIRPKSIATVGEESGLPKESARTVCQDREGRLWMTLQYGGLACEEAGRWRVLGSADGWPGAGACCVAPAVDGGVWVGMTERGLMRWRDGKAQAYGSAGGADVSSVRSLLAAANGDVWIVTDWPNRLRVLRGGRLMDVQAPKNMQAMIALAEDARGVVWAGTSNGQLYRMQGGSLVCEQAAAPEFPAYVRSLCASADGSLWIGYGGAGLGRLKDGRYASLSSEQGLADRHISHVLDDGAGRLWMTGNHGLFFARVDDVERVMAGATNRLRCVSFGRGEGVVNLQPMWQFCPTTCRTREGRLLFASGDGLLSVSPWALRQNPVPPLLALSGISVDDRPVARSYASRFASGEPLGAGGLDLLGGAALELGPEHDKLEFAFTALSLGSPENVHFRYWLKNFDKGWVEGGTQRGARYPRLPAGRYEFHVTACNEQGVWNAEGLSLPVVVRPFYWQTWWFRGVLWTGAAALVAGLAVAVQRRRHQTALRAVERQHAVERERSRIAQDMHDQLGSGLTKASMITETLRRTTGREDAAEPRFQMLRETLDRLTVTMDELVWAVNPRHDTLDGLASYVVRYTQEYLADTEVACALDVPADLPAVSVGAPVRHNLFLAFEEALSNAARHAAATQVKVSMAYSEGTLRLTVADNGRGFDEAHVRAGSHGLENMRQRLSGQGGRCEIRSAPGAGTQICFSLALPAQPQGG